MIISF